MSKLESIKEFAKDIWSDHNADIISGAITVAICGIAGGIISAKAYKEGFRNGELTGTINTMHMWSECAKEIEKEN